MHYILCINYPKLREISWLYIYIFTLSKPESYYNFNFNREIYHRHNDDDDDYDAPTIEQLYNKVLLLLQVTG